MPLSGLRRGFASILVSTGIAGGVLLAQPPDELSGVYTIQHQSNGRYLDAHTTPEKDYGVVTRRTQENPTQKWILSRVNGTIYTIQQQTYLTSNKDFGVVTRSVQSNDTQRWIVTRVTGHIYTIQQQRTPRFMDAYESEAKDWAVVMRPPQPNSRTQRWIFYREIKVRGLGGPVVQ